MAAFEQGGIFMNVRATMIIAAGFIAALELLSKRRAVAA
jgi:hypothetical protein